MEFPVSKEVCDAYSNHVDQLYKKICYNNRQNRILARIRDTLLPKLLSGELEERATEAFVEVSRNDDR